MRTTIWISAGVLGLVLLVSPATADQVILDDLIVDGSVCAGFDCVNGESFGFDTLRLKENNLRIRFFDTSSSASFPTNDWQIAANQTSNGGAERFSIEDIDGGRIPFIIEAGAPNNALYVDDGGRLGLGTGVPVVEVHIVDGDTPTLRLEQDGSSGFTPQTWDVAGNETNFFIRDVTNGSTLPLRIRPGAPTSAIDIANSGNVGIGTSAPSQALHVRRTNAAATSVRLENTNGTAQQVALVMDNTQGEDWEMRLNAAGNLNFTRVGLAGQQLQINGANGNVSTSNNLSVGGTLSKGAGAFKIDHPLDPENRYLQHSFVESPDMLNIYNGNVELDDEGRGVVELPIWFEALNADYRYQLTAIGAPAPSLHVAAGVADGEFEIAGGEPGQVVSWQVTGVRHDAFAEANRIEVEPWKAPEDRGAYLHPAAFGLPEDRLIGAETRSASTEDAAPATAEQVGSAER